MVADLPVPLSPWSSTLLQGERPLLPVKRPAAGKLAHAVFPVAFKHRVQFQRRAGPQLRHCHHLGEPVRRQLGRHGPLERLKAQLGCAGEDPRIIPGQLQIVRLHPARGHRAAKGRVIIAQVGLQIVVQVPFLLSHLKEQLSIGLHHGRVPPLHLLEQGHQRLHTGQLQQIPKYAQRAQL